MRVLVAVGLFTFTCLVVPGCSPPQPTTPATLQLKPLPAPASPADAGKAKQPRGEGKGGESPATHP